MDFDPQNNADALFDSQYLRWYHLNGKPALVTITAVNRNVEMTLPGGIPAKKPVVELEQVQGSVDDMKPLVLNKTNKNSIVSVLGPKPSEWTGKQVVLIQDTTQMYNRDLKKMQTVPCIRIRAPKVTK